MTGRNATRWTGIMRRIRLGDDRGASLVLAVIFMAVVSVVVAVVLSLADSSIRTTLALREQAADAATADGAAQVAINALRKGLYDGTAGGCFGLDSTLVLSNLYPGPSGPANSAVVTCEPDPTTSGVSVEINPSNRPGNSLLTLGTAATEDGLYLSDPASRDMKINGTVFSNSSINVAQGSLTTDNKVTARGSCTGTINSNPAPACDIGIAPDPSGDDPDYPPAVDSTAVQTVPVCVIADQLVTFTPGLYNDVIALNNLSRCTNGIFHFPPGTYYFDLPADTPWVIDNAYVVGGTPTAPLVAGTPPTIPGSCQSPTPPSPIGGWTPPGPNAGVEFVFGGGSHIVVRSAQVELCGSYSTTRPPIALYGLKTSVGPVPALSGCIIAEPYPSTGCALIRAENSPGGRFYIRGTTYLPNAVLDIGLNNQAGRAFSVGVVVRSLQIRVNGGADLSRPIISVPPKSPAGRRTVVYLNVYVCPGAGTCSAGTGTYRLRAKVGVLDPTGVPVPGSRKITVYSWSVLR